MDIYDRQGEPITLDQYCAIRENRVAKDDIAGVRVSTIYLGIDHRHGPGPPLIFETMIFGGKYDGAQWRYSTEKQAIAGHDRAVQMVQRHLRRRITLILVAFAVVVALTILAAVV